jgi:hypothetical protein
LICVYQVVLVVGVLLDDIEGLLAYQAWLFALRDYKAYHSQNWFDMLWLQQLFVVWPDNWLVQVNFSVELSIHLPSVTTKCTDTTWLRGIMTNSTHVTLITQASTALWDRIPLPGRTSSQMPSLFWHGRRHSPLRFCFDQCGGVSVSIYYRCHGMPEPGDTAEEHRIR